MIKIAITCDHTIFRKSLSILISMFSKMSVVIEASDSRELFEQMEKTEADIILLDLNLPTIKNIVKLIRTKYEATKVIIFTSLEKFDAGLAISNYGAHGYLDKSVKPEELEKAISLIIKNSSYTRIPRAIDNIIFTERELDVIKLAAKEYSGKEIADNLNISLRTVEVHKKNLMQKTDSKNFIGVLLYALHNNVLNIADFRKIT